MKSTKECRHIWHDVFAMRSIKTITTDLVTVGIFCPKCKVQDTLEYEIPLERTGDDSKDSRSIQLDEDRYIKVKDSIVISNLKKLNYTEDKIKLVLENARTFNKIDFIVFKDSLNPEHKEIAKLLLTSEQIN